MKRRVLFSTAIALVVAARHSVAQPAARKVRIGFLGSSTPDPLTMRTQVDPLRKGLRELGWTEGQNLAPIEFRWAEGKYERFPVLLDELLRLDLDLLITVSPRMAMLAKEAAPKASVPPKALADLVPGWGQTLGVAISLADVRGPDDFDAAFAALMKERVNGIVFVADPMVWVQRAKLGELCLKHRLPSVWGGAGYLDTGGLA